ncbi:hypothetical protein DFQ26_008850 [Actinomortierella ambigua]|nr:hypothetical protein DFQ26_008850 [Actinomortierella ambigua]
MSREKAPWRLIAQETGLSVEDCQRLFYTKLDWRAPYYWTIDGHPGRPDKAQIARLVYLVEHEGYTFDEIAERRLLYKRIAKNGHYLRYYHPLVLEHKYAEVVRHRKRLQRQRMAELGHLPEHVVLLRAVELFGQDWERIAQHTNTEMARAHEVERAKCVTLLDRFRSRLAAAVAAATADKPNRDARGIKQLETELAELESEVAKQQDPGWLSAETAQSLFHKVQRRHGQVWTTEDDALLVYMILETMRQHHWRTPTQVPSSLSSLDRGNDPTTWAYWAQVANALGNHTPRQCLQRWRAMSTLDDRSKQVSNARWQRFEVCQFWMAWDFLVSQPQILQKIQASFRDVVGSADPRLHDITAPATGMGTRTKARTAAKVKEQPELGPLMKEVVQVLSLSQYAAAFQRNRGADQCQHRFESTVRKLLSRPKNDAKKPASKPSSLNAGAIFIQAIQEQNVDLIIHFIRTAVVDPLLTRSLQKLAESPSEDAVAAEENCESLATFPKEYRLRSLWSPTLRKRLQWRVIEAKGGIKIADEDIDWDEIAEQLTKEAPNGEDGRVPNITSQQCLSTWRYILAEHDLLEAEETEAQVDVKGTCLQTSSGRQAEGLEDDNRQSKQAPKQRRWLEHEIVSLEIGVRRFGTIWADVRAQYLPGRTISEIHQKWFEISSGTAVDPTPALDRAQEEDYQTLMHALKISTGPTPSI